MNSKIQKHNFIRDDDNSYIIEKSQHKLQTFAIFFIL